MKERTTSVLIVSEGGPPSLSVSLFVSNWMDHSSMDRIQKKQIIHKRTATGNGELSNPTNASTLDRYHNSSSLYFLPDEDIDQEFDPATFHSIRSFYSEKKYNAIFVLIL